MKSVECPLCGRSSRASPFLSTQNTPWSLDCACSDVGFCLYHQHSDENPPARPSEKVLEARAQKEHEESLRNHEALLKAFDSYKLTAERLAAAQDALEGVVAQCRFNCNEESNCGICAIALEALKAIKDESNEQE